MWYEYKEERDGDDDDGGGGGEAQRAVLILMSSAEPNSLCSVPVSENSRPFQSVCSMGIFTESN